MLPYNSLPPLDSHKAASFYYKNLCKRLDILKIKAIVIYLLKI